MGLGLNISFISKLNKNGDKTSIVIFGENPNGIVKNLARSIINQESLKDDAVNSSLTYGRIIDYNADIEERIPTSLAINKLGIFIDKLKVKGDVLSNDDITLSFEETKLIDIKGDDVSLTEYNDGLVTIKDNETNKLYIIGGITEEVRKKADGFNGLTTHKEVAIRHKGIFFAKEVIELSNTQFDYLFSTSESQINTEINYL